jgi:hypothetical protein
MGSIGVDNAAQMSRRPPLRLLLQCTDTGAATSHPDQRQPRSDTNSARGMMVQSPAGALRRFKPKPCEQLLSYSNDKCRIMPGRLPHIASDESMAPPANIAVCGLVGREKRLLAADLEYFAVGSAGYVGMCDRDTHNEPLRVPLGPSVPTALRCTRRVPGLAGGVSCRRVCHRLFIDIDRDLPPIAGM